MKLMLHDLKLKRFGKLVAIKYYGRNKNNKSLWLCKCDCGEHKPILRSNLISTNTESCGCTHKRTRKMASNFRTGYTKNSLGYLINNLKKNLEHRIVMQEHLGRALLSNEIVHHIDGNKLNNSLSNLEIMTRAEHMNHHRSGW